MIFEKLFSMKHCIYIECSSILYQLKCAEMILKKVKLKKNILFEKRFLHRTIPKIESTRVKRSDNKKLNPKTGKRYIFSQRLFLHKISLNTPETGVLRNDKRQKNLKCEKLLCMKGRFYIKLI